ncbi:hypothetical protein EPUS_04883 [Endocarpon pusillum Z07020]|uniref:Uncharacterized protein n=1 Tax=Endocarpon pusillum (strain Z07020 / HMAS-L-300199) TaxID=1263415 RepID=U1GSX6_ENDPU|nr:uncharacterized protein EPUS_04883 [Endocarpon pusillum Z07020]ERF75101.1 hypothetical protein EPUS_04883 [Endocarpon pusillum Z07020]
MSEIQLTQALRTVSSSLIFNHMTILQQSIQLRDRRRVRWDQYAMVFQKAHSFNKWISSADSSRISIRSTFKDRNILSGSLTLAVEYLRKPGIAALWALQCRTQAYDSTEILESLICQALKLDSASHTDLTFSFQLRRYLDAQGDEDYFNILADILSHFKLIYIIIQLEAMFFEAASRFQRHLDGLLDRFKTRAPGPILKILVASSGPLVSPPQVRNQQVLRIGGKKQLKKYTTRSTSLAPLKCRQSCDHSPDD